MRGSAYGRMGGTLSGSPGSPGMGRYEPNRLEQLLFR